VQLYVTDAEASVRVPARSLAGVERVHLKPGEKRSVSFTIEPRQLAVIKDDGRAVVEPGESRVSVFPFRSVNAYAVALAIHIRVRVQLVGSPRVFFRHRHRPVPVDGRLKYI